MPGKPEYYRAIAKAILSNAGCIIRAIDQYLAKTDEDLADSLADEGYAEAEDTVAAINAMQEEVAEALQNQTDDLVTALETAAGSGWTEAQQAVSDMMDEDDIAEQVESSAADMLQTQIPKLANVYMQETDGELVVDTIRQRTESWIASWSQRLGELMRINTHKQITDIIQRTIDQGESIEKLTRKIMDGGWRNEYYQARCVAVTEVLRAHSVAREEAIQQSPSTDRKEWRHTGAHKNKPRPNHVKMDGQIVPKDQPFVLKGKDGVVYHPMYPRDPCLPPGESVNCHCIHRGVAADHAIGMSLEERQKLQQKYIEEDDGAWKKELDEQNKAKAGITPYSTLENFKEKSREEQIRYLGKTKMTLYDAGLIDSDEMLSKVKKTSLQKLRENGIFTVDSKAAKHSTVGDFSSLKNPKKPAGGSNGGRMKGGGHSQANLDELANRGTAYSIEKTYDNGVRIGGVEGHAEKSKILGRTGQSWFPENWDAEKIKAAGAYAANRPAKTRKSCNKSGEVVGYNFYQEYDGVTVGVFADGERNISTIFPDGMQREIEGDGWDGYE